jgi:hypothetical protein
MESGVIWHLQRTANFTFNSWQILNPKVQWNAYTASIMRRVTATNSAVSLLAWRNQFMET